MAEEYGISNVTDDLGFLLTLTGLVTLDNEGFWYDPVLNKRFSHKLDRNDDAKEVLAFRDNLPKGDYHFFNPFGEGFGKKSPAVQLFYKLIRIRLNMSIKAIISAAMDVAIVSKEDPTTKTPPEFVKILSTPIDKKNSWFDVIDETMTEEFDKLFNKIDNDILFIPYIPQQMTTQVRSDVLTDPDWDKKFGDGIRKKTLSAFKAAICGVLGISKAEDLKEFSVKYDPELKTTGRLYTTLSVYMKIYLKINALLPMAYAGEDGKEKEETLINLEGLSAVIERLPAAYALAKHVIRPTISNSDVSNTSAGDTSAVSFRSDNSPASRFGNNTVSNEPPPNSRFGYNQPDSRNSRWGRNDVSDSQVDPLSPSVPRYFGGNSRSSSWSNASSFGNDRFGGNYGTRYGSGYGGGGRPSDFDTSPPSNFGSPGTSRRYYG